MSTGSYSDSRDKRKTLRKLPPTDRGICGTVGGYTAHYRAGEEACGTCLQASAEASRRAAVLRMGLGEFGKLPTQQWHFDEPFEVWRLLQTKQLDDGFTYIAGPWYSRIRVPKSESGDRDPSQPWTFEFRNGSAVYLFHHQDDEFVYLEIDRKSLRDWLTVIEETYE